MEAPAPFSRLSWLLPLGAGLAAAAFLGALTGMRDTDAFHHLALGREILRSGAIPAEDPFLYPLAGLEVGRMPYWLASVLFYASDALAGPAGPVLLAGLLLSVLCVVLWLDSTRDVGDAAAALVALVPLVLAVAALRARAVPRPEIFANVFIALTAFALRRYAEGNRRLLLAFPLVTIAWANLHASTLSGVGLILLFVALGLVARAFPRLPLAPAATVSKRDLFVAGSVGLAGLVTAGLFSVRGLDPIIISIKFVLSSTGLADAALGGPLGDPLPYLKHHVFELQPLSTSEWLSPFGALVLLAALSFPLGRRRATAWEFVAAVLLVALTARNARYLPIAAVLMAPVTARNLVAALPRAGGRTPVLRLGAGALLLTGALALAGYHVTHDGLPFGTALVRKAAPVTAAEYLARHAPGAKVFNTFQLGGYLEWRLDRPIFQDGRALLLPADLEPAFAEPINAGVFRPLDDRYRFDALVLAYPTHLDQATVAALDATAGNRDWLADRATWALVAFDDGGLLYLRRDGPFAALASRDEYRAARPGNPFSRGKLMDPVERAAFIADYRRALGETPECSKCRFHLGMALISDGQGAEAEALLAASLPGANARYAGELLYGMGLAADLQGDASRARAHLTEALRRDDRALAARRALANIELDEGRAAVAWALLEQNLGAGPSREDFALAASAKRALGDAAGADALAAQVANADARAQAERHYLDGLRAMQAGRLDAAAAAYRSSLELVEQSAPAHSNLGWVYFDLGQVDRALGEFRRAIEVDPLLPEPHFGLGLILQRQGDRPGAAAAFRSFLRLQPRGPWAQQAEEHLRRLGA